MTIQLCMQPTAFSAAKTRTASNKCLARATTTITTALLHCHVYDLAAFFVHPLAHFRAEQFAVAVCLKATALLLIFKCLRLVYATVSHKSAFRFPFSPFSRARSIVLIVALKALQKCVRFTKRYFRSHAR